MTIQKARSLVRIFEFLFHQTQPASLLSVAPAFWRRHYAGAPPQPRGMPLEALDDRLLEDIGAPTRMSGRFPDRAEHTWTSAKVLLADTHSTRDKQHRSNEKC
jgi:hypothetical protein